MNKKGAWLIEEGGAIVLAIIGSVLIIYLVVSLIGISTQKFYRDKKGFYLAEKCAKNMLEAYPSSLAGELSRTRAC